MPSYVTSLLRVLGGVIGGWLIAKGYITADQAPEIGGAVLTLVASGWAITHTASTRAALTSAIAAPASKAS